MMDTVALKIEHTQWDKGEAHSTWTVEKPELFEHEDIEDYIGKNWHMWNDPDNKDRPDGYFPHVEVWNFVGRYNSTYALFMRFSVPKLFHGNNLMEVNGSQFNAVCVKLQQTLKTMGIQVDVSDIRKAEVIQVHYGKNLVCNGIPLPLVLERLAVAKPPIPRMDINKVSYLNSSQVTFHNSTREVCFYDKYQEILQDKNFPKKLGWIFGRGDLKNILRMEMRLNKKSALTLHFGKGAVSFQTAFDEAKAKSIILQYWKPVYESLQTAVYNFGAPEYHLLLLLQQGVSLPQSLFAVALNTLANSIGREKVRQLIKRCCNKSSQVSNWMAKMSLTKPPIIQSEYDFLRIIDTELRQFRWLGRFSWANRKSLLNAAPLLGETLMTTDDASKYAKINRRVLQKKLQDEKISHLRIDKLYRLRKGDFWALVNGLTLP